MVDPGGRPPVPEVDVAEAVERVGVGHVLLDVRERHEWDAGHAPGARHLPLSEFTSRRGELARDAAYVVVCRVGARSAKATALLLEAGTEAVNVTGGMLAWESAGFCVTRDDGSAGIVV